jgi:hypothetical protein
MSRENEKTEEEKYQDERRSLGFKFESTSEKCRKYREREEKKNKIITILRTPFPGKDIFLIQISLELEALEVYMEKNKKKLADKIVKKIKTALYENLRGGRP